MSGAAAGADGEVAVIGLARSGRAAAKLLAGRGRRVYASDSRAGAEIEQVAERLREQAVDVQLGGHDLERVRAASLVVVSPGVPPDASPVTAARAAGVPVLSEVAVGLEALPQACVLAVTGTNGKTTVTALIAHLLAGMGERVAAAGNIGHALSELALQDDPPDWIALEMSSFQLHDTPGFAPHVGVLTNLAPDHLDRYATMDEYYADKALMFAAAGDHSRWVTNADDPAVQRMAARVPGTHYRFALAPRAADGRDVHAWYDRDAGSLMLLGVPLCERSGLSLLGEHNVANALAAALAVAAASDDPADRDRITAIGGALQSFRGLPHRLELVSEAHGIRWINDSKATNVASARVAIEAMEGPTVLLLGGRHKGESYAGLVPSFAGRVRHVVAFGEAAPVIGRDLAGSGVQVEQAENELADVVARARRASRPGDTVLLAPACSSFDMFRDYEERGDRFRELAAAG